MSRENAPSSERPAERAAASVLASIRSATASACARSSLSLRNARRVNSPGSASRRPNRATGVDAALQNQLQHDRAAVALQFEHVLAGVGMRRRKVQRDAAVERVAGRIEERHVARVTRRQRLAGERLHQRLGRSFAGAAERNPHDADSASAGRSSNGDDGIGIGGEHGIGRRELRERKALMRGARHCNASDQT